MMSFYFFIIVLLLAREPSVKSVIYYVVMKALPPRRAHRTDRITYEEPLKLEFATFATNLWHSLLLDVLLRLSNTSSVVYVCM